MISRIFHKFGYAFQGLWYGLVRDTSIQIQCFFAVIAVVIAAVLGFTTAEWLILSFSITLVLAMEFVNTALEKLCDFVHPEQSEKIKLIKDVGAAAVLTASIGALVIGIIMVLNHL